ncbi:MAG: serine/threonine-protein kinase [Nannocystaceae bacterium]
MTQSRSPTSPDLLIGRTVGTHYVISKVLGRGLRSATYLAEHRSLHRDVVLKLLDVSWAGDSAAASRFDQAARSLSTLEAPNVGALIDHGRDPGRGVFVVTEFVKGETLESFLGRRGALSIEEFVPIAAQILKGLGAAHLRGLLHLDITLDNIMVAVDDSDPSRGIIRILDLGLVQLVEDHVQGIEAPTGGDPRFLAPEQISNKPLDTRTDVYALGALFYQMLAGRPPFAGTDAQVIYNHINDTPPSLADVGTDEELPSELVELIESCLAKDADDRPIDANEIVELLIDSVPAALFRGYVPLPQEVADSDDADVSDDDDDDAEDMSDALEDEDEVVPDAAASADARLAAPVLGDSLTETQDDRKDAPTSDSGKKLPVLGDLAISSPRSSANGWTVAGDPAAESSEGRATLSTEAVGEASEEEEKKGGSGFLIFLVLVAAVVGGIFFLKPELLGLGPPPAMPQPQPQPTAPPIEVTPAADVGSLMISAKRLEESGDSVAAIATYHQILALDPEHAEANARLAALKGEASDADSGDGTSTGATTTGDDEGATTGDDEGATTGDDEEATGTTGDDEGATGTTGDDVAAGTVEVTFEVNAKGTLYVDGKKVGDVPGSHALRPGKRKIKITGNSRLPYEKTHTVSEGMEPLSITLKPKPKTRTDENIEIDPMAEGPVTEFKFKK